MKIVVRQWNLLFGSREDFRFSLMQNWCRNEKNSFRSFCTYFHVMEREKLPRGVPISPQLGHRQLIIYFPLLASSSYFVFSDQTRRLEAVKSPSTSQASIFDVNFLHLIFLLHKQSLSNDNTLFKLITRWRSWDYVVASRMRHENRFCLRFLRCVCEKLKTVAFQTFHLFIAFTTRTSFAISNNKNEADDEERSHRHQAESMFATRNNFLIGRAAKKSDCMEQTYVKCAIHFDGANIARVS